MIGRSSVRPPSYGSAEWLAEAIDAGLSGRQPMEEALAAYEQTRNNAELPYFDLTTQLAALEPPPAEVQELLEALRGNRAGQWSIRINDQWRICFT